MIRPLLLALALTADMDINGETFRLVTWHRQAGGEVHATTDQGERVTVAISEGRGGVAVGKRYWHVTGAAWDGATMTGRAMLGVSDEWMAKAFGVEVWG